MYKKILNKKFYVDEIKNTCVCVLDFCLVDESQLECEVIDKYAKKCKGADKELYSLENLDEDGNPITSTILVRKFRVRGKSKCSSEDVFDETIGTDIAEFRAEREMSRIEREVILNIIDKLDKRVRRQYENMYNKSSMFSEMRKSYIKNLCCPNEDIEECSEE